MEQRRPPRRDRDAQKPQPASPREESGGAGLPRNGGGAADNRVVAPKVGEEDEGVETSLRPRKLADYIGQEKVKENLKILIAASKKRGEALDHVLFYGPPGLGKTSMANVIANEMNVNIKTTSGPAVEHAGDLASILTTLQKDDILFIDEIHRLSRVVEERLYSAMEDFALDIIIGKGPSARNLRLSLPHFTIIGATTRIGALTAPLRDRFGAIYRMEFYSEEALRQIISRSARILQVQIDEDGTLEIARRSRGTPRIANRLVKRVRDYAQVKGDGHINREIANEALNRLEVDNLGLDETDRLLLLAIIKKFDGGPVGLDTLAASTSEEAETIEDVYEPYLLQLGFLIRTPRGRMATKLAYAHLGIPPKPEVPGQSTLW